MSYFCSITHAVTSSDVSRTTQWRLQLPFSFPSLPFSSTPNPILLVPSLAPPCLSLLIQQGVWGCAVTLLSGSKRTQQANTTRHYISLKLHNRRNRHKFAYFSIAIGYRFFIVNGSWNPRHWLPLCYTIICQKNWHKLQKYRTSIHGCPKNKPPSFCHNCNKYWPPFTETLNRKCTTI